jgi:hypothetical protein
MRNISVDHWTLTDITQKYNFKSYKVILITIWQVTLQNKKAYRECFKKSPRNNRTGQAKAFSHIKEQAFFSNVQTRGFGTKKFPSLTSNVSVVEE